MEITLVFKRGHFCTKILAKKQEQCTKQNTHLNFVYLFLCKVSQIKTKTYGKTHAKLTSIISTHSDDAKNLSYAIKGNN